MFTASNVEAPRDRSYKLTVAVAEVVADKGMILQMRMFGPGSKENSIASSGPFCVGVSPRRVTLRAPAGTDWFPRAVPADWPLIVVDALCQFKGQVGTALFSLKLHFLLSPEEVPEACPTAMVTDHAWVRLG